MICNRCGNPTKDKWITSKKTGRQHKMFECTSGCKEGNWPYSFFPPRDSAHASAPQASTYQPATPQQSAGNVPAYATDILARLKSIDSKLVEIKDALKIGGRMNFTHDEMQPDENTPF